MGRDIILLDGAAGTTLWELAEAQGIERAPVWKYNIEQPQLVLELHRRYIAAGCRMIQTNTFSANPDSVARSSDYSPEQVVRAAVELAKKAVEGTDVKFYLSFGPLSALLEPYGKLTREETFRCYSILAGAGCEAGAEYVMLETFMDLEMMRIAVEAVKQYPLEVVCSMTFEKRMRTMMGNSVAQIVAALEPMGISALGMNCSYGPVKALEIIREYSRHTKLPLYFKPNAGVGESYGPEDFAAEIAPALDYVSYIGGCCGCDDSYIRALGAIL